jgi:hypothetical protein
MPSSARDRLHVVYDAYSQAYDRRLDDWKQATSKAQADAISRNVDRLETLYLKAAKQALDANGVEVEAAYEAAKAAQDDIDEAYQEAKALAEKITLVGKIVGKIGDLISKAAK